MRALRPVVVAGILAASVTAFAQGGVKVEMRARVAEGERPRVRFLVQERLDKLGVELRRDDGKVAFTSTGPLAPGSVHDLLLDGDAGVHKWSGTVTIARGGVTRDSALNLETIVAPKLQVTVDKARVDLAARRMEVKLSRPAGKVTVKVFGATGAPAVEDDHDFSGKDPGDALVVTWPALPTGTEVGRIDLRVADADGFYQGLSLYPWSVHIPHEEVTFATGSAAISPAESPKLEASLRTITGALAKHRNLGPIKLYIAGHTDSVGKPDYNVRLSQRRAQAIASWFRKRGLRLPIAFEGFGEHAPAVSTTDEQDEPRNRRVDYILAIEDPPLKATAFRASWKRIP